MSQNGWLYYLFEFVKLSPINEIEFENMGSITGAVRELQSVEIEVPSAQAPTRTL